MPQFVTIFVCLLLSLSTSASSSAIGEALALPNYTLKLAVSTSASKDAIWRLWEDVENWKKFDTLLDYSYLDSGQTFTTGAKGVIKARGTSKTRFELLEVKPGVSFIEKLKAPLFQSIELHRYFDPSEHGTTVFVHEVRFKGRLKSVIYFAAASTFKKELPLVMGRMREIAEQESLGLLSN